MTLYEITDGRTGESYCRAYAWAADAGEALRLYEAANPGERAVTMTPLLLDRAPPFCTRLDDCGASFGEGGP